MRSPDVVARWSVIDLRRAPLALAALLVLAVPARAQQTPCPCPPPSPPPPAWGGSLGGGLSLTSGNSNTNSYNLDFALTHDARRTSVFKLDGSYLRTDTDGASTVDRTNLGARYEYAPGGRRFFGFGEVRYLRDAFKEVDHLGRRRSAPATASRTGTT